MNNKHTSDCTLLVKEALFRVIPDVSFGESSDYRSARYGLLRYNYLRKFNDHKKSSEKSALTMAKWRASEASCFVANRAIGSASDFSLLGQLLRTARNLIESVIGVSPPKRLFQELCKFSPGASYRTKRGVHYSVKMEDLTVTHAASYFLDAFKGITETLTIVPGNRMCAVPKTSTVDRLISIEPSGNAFLQQRVGGYFKSCLLSKAGIDLYDQQPNQIGAFEAYAFNYATIDLESASDSICCELVRAVLPHDWYVLLNALRSPKTEISKGKWVYLDKFSSMGNGYTFELETLIFWALCKSVCQDSKLLVYGDDIIVTQRDASNCISALTLCGFTVNKEKSFTSGRFFESCGKYYFDLEDVTPCFQKEAISCVPSAMRAHNRLVRWALRLSNFEDYRLIRPVLKLIRERFGHERCIVPFGCDRDDGWLVDPRLITQDLHGDYMTHVIRIRPIKDSFVNESNCLRFKLYSPAHLNESPKGYAERDTGNPQPGFVVRRAKIWGSAVTSCS